MALAPNPLVAELGVSVKIADGDEVAKEF